MKNIILCLCAILVISCKTDKLKSQSVIASVETEVLKSLIFPELEPYLLKLKLHKHDNDLYDFEILMTLNDGAYFVSPNAKQDFSGKFTFFIEENDKFMTVDKLIETPISKEEYDNHPFVNGYVNWVRVDTNYKQKIKRLSKEDFRVMGYIQFTIEPRCTLEKIPVIIKSEDGVLKFEKFVC